MPPPTTATEKAAMFSAQIIIDTNPKNKYKTKGNKQRNFFSFSFSILITFAMCDIAYLYQMYGDGSRKLHNDEKKIGNITINVNEMEVSQ